MDLHWSSYSQVVKWTYLDTRRSLPGSVSAKLSFCGFTYVYLSSVKASSANVSALVPISRKTNMFAVFRLSNITETEGYDGMPNLTTSHGSSSPVFTQIIKFLFFSSWSQSTDTSQWVRGQAFDSFQLNILGTSPESLPLVFFSCTHTTCSTILVCGRQKFLMILVYRPALLDCCPSFLAVQYTHTNHSETSRSFIFELINLKLEHIDIISINSL